MARMEKQRDKAAKRLERKLARESGVEPGPDVDETAVEPGEAPPGEDKPPEG